MVRSIKLTRNFATFKMLMEACAKSNRVNPVRIMRWYFAGPRVRGQRQKDKELLQSLLKNGLISWRD